MSDLSRSSIRISIDSNFHEFYKELSENNDPEKSPFRTMKDVFMLAVCMGFHQGNRKPIIGTKRQIFHWTQLSDQLDVPILKSIAISTTNDIQVLMNPENIIQIAEEYANAGIHKIKLFMNDNFTSNLWSLVDIIR